MIDEHEYRLRECVHRPRGAEGDYYGGQSYLEHLQRLRSEAAVRVAANVAPFFWADAANVRVWLCEECAGQLGLRREANHARG
ncbi:MAG TPA: hypothetical protein VEY09_11760 [Pyrinomonadaceae bacterium]|nr:hypothetical protein [Pyrinomonadaceae bacterium]